MLKTILLTENFPYSSRRVLCFDPASNWGAFDSYRSENGISDALLYKKGFNFDEGDGLETDMLFDNPPERANYVFVFDEAGTSFLSRWFVISKTRTTNYASNQYSFHLKRDVLADFSSVWLKTPAFIQKGTIQSNISPLLFNKEDMTFNQVKMGEYPLPDESGVQWIVGYIARNADLTDSAKKLNGAVVTFQDAEAPVANAMEFDSVDSLSKAIGVDINKKFAAMQSGYVTVAATYVVSASAKPMPIDLTKDVGGAYSTGLKVFSHGEKRGLEYSKSVTAEEALSSLNAQTVISQSIGMTAVTLKDYAALSAWDSRTVYIAALKKNYIVSLSSSVPSTAKRSYQPAASSTAFQTVKGSVATSGSDFTSTGGLAEGDVTVGYVLSGEFALTLVPVSDGAMQVSLLSPTLRPHLEDAPFDMFCIPYADDAKVETELGALAISKSEAWNAAVALVENLSQGTYDLQLLPYCPNRDLLKADDSSYPAKCHISTSGMEVDYAYTGTVSRDSSTGEVTEFSRKAPACPIVWCRRSSFSFRIWPGNLPSTFAYPLDPEEVKVRDETESARLVSPNLAGGFDFSPMMNCGVAGFRADCTYKPFNPYIHIAPIFAFMYGGDFGDARGLVCGGDFSLPRITDSWESYQQSNKNYQSIFDREIQNLQVTQKYQKISDVAGAVAGAFQGASSGALAGSAAGPVGAAVGGIVGGTASAIAGGIDLAMGDRMRAEAIDYRKDLFGYQLGNIRALPQSLAKTAAQNANNRPFPFVEWYRASNEEIAALRSKIEYDGMSVGVVAEPAEYMANGGFIQCALAGATPAGVDSRLWNELGNELLKGAYVTVEEE